ncbi:SDR family oxidoreductase [Nannocystis pusilla]|uniref:SDR family oxidoreductase n=1 Tax=Nannocystis pusilla TaxID=889268 RepID=UPI003B81F01F
MHSKIAIVTGAAGGVIGPAVALSLLRDGWSVALAGRRLQALEETAHRAGDAAERAFPVVVDVADPAAVEALFTAVRRRWDRIDLLFNNAGAFLPSTPIEELAFADWTRVLQVNLTGTFLCAQQAFRVMKSQSPMGGRIINNGALSAQVPRPEAVAFSASKSGVTGLTRALALEGRRYDIACGQIDIGNAGTTTTEQNARQADRTVALEPYMDVQHVADAVVMMANLPLGANIPALTVMPSKMPFAGRG